MKRCISTLLALLVVSAQAAEPPSWDACPKMAAIAGKKVRLNPELWVNGMPQIDKPASSAVIGTIKVWPELSGVDVDQVWLTRGDQQWSSAVKGGKLEKPAPWGVGPVQVRAHVLADGKQYWLKAATKVTAVQ